MEPLSRLWFALPGDDPDELERLSAALRRRSLDAVVAAEDEGSRHAAAALARPAGLAAEVIPGLGHGGPTGIDLLLGLAARHADREVLVIAPEATLRAALRASLGLDALDEPGPVRPRRGALYAFDWPTGRVAWARPRLVGCDLDWLPPWRSGQAHARYPGGPAAAGSSRT